MSAAGGGQPFSGAPALLRTCESKNHGCSQTRPTQRPCLATVAQAAPTEHPGGGATRSRSRTLADLFGPRALALAGRRSRAPAHMYISLTTPLASSCPASSPLAPRHNAPPHFVSQTTCAVHYLRPYLAPTPRASHSRHDALQDGLHALLLLSREALDHRRHDGREQRRRALVQLLEQVDHRPTRRLGGVHVRILIR